MAVELASGYVSLVPSTKNIGSAIAKEMGGPIEQAAQETSGRVGGIFKKLAVGLGGVFAVKAGFDMFKGFIGAAEESRQVSAQTAAAIKSTGGAAQVSAKQVGALAEAIAAKTGVDDEAIQSGENLLLTFTNIQNRAGKGNDVFNQSTAVLTDMAAALGGDVSSNAIQLGKALNDPVAGISALTRVGVTFSEEQKKTIKQMVATGDVAGAQKVILAELNKEFGGSAAAQATAGKKLSVIWGNLQERLGGVLLPIVDKVASWIGERLPGAFDAAGRVIGPIVRTLGLGISAMVAAFKDPDVTSNGFVGAMERVGVALRQAWEQVDLFVHALRTGFTRDEGTPIERIALIVRDLLLPAFQKVTDFVKDHTTVVLVGLAAAVLLLISPFAAVVAALVFAYTKFAWLRAGIQAVVDFFRDTVSPAVGKLASYITDQIGHLTAWWRENWDDIQKATRNVLIAIGALVAAFIAPFVFIWQQAGDQILSILKIAWAQIRLVIETGVRIVRDIVTFFVALLSGDWGKAWDAIRDIPAAVLDYVVGTVRHILEVLWHVAQGALDVLLGVFRAGWNGIQDVVMAVIRAVVDTFLGMVETIISGGARAFGWVPGIGPKLKEAAAAFEQFRDDVNRSLGGIKDKIINVSIRGVERHIDPNIGGSFDDGGVVPGPVGKPTLILAHGGEVVVSNEQQRRGAFTAAAAAMPAAGVVYAPTYQVSGVSAAEEFHQMLDEHDREFLRTYEAV